MMFHSVSDQTPTPAPTGMYLEIENKYGFLNQITIKPCHPFRVIA